MMLRKSVTGAVSTSAAGLPTSHQNQRTAFTPVDPFQAPLRIHPTELQTMFSAPAAGGALARLRQPPLDLSCPQEEWAGPDLLPSPPDPPPCSVAQCTPEAPCVTCRGQRDFLTAKCQTTFYEGENAALFGTSAFGRPSRRCCGGFRPASVKPLMEGRESDLPPAPHRKQPENRFLGSNLETSLGALVPKEEAPRLDAAQFTERRNYYLEANADGPFEVQGVTVCRRKENFGNLDRTLAERLPPLKRPGRRPFAFPRADPVMLSDDVRSAPERPTRHFLRHHANTLLLDHTAM